MTAVSRTFLMYLEAAPREKLNAVAEQTGESKSAILKRGLDLVYAEKFGPAKQQNEEMMSV